MAKKLDGVLPTKYEVSVSYSSLFDNERVSVLQVLDLAMFNNLSVLQEKGEKDLIKAIELIKDSNSDMASSLSKLSNSLVEGIWLKNAERSFSAAIESPLTWESRILKNFNEFRGIWKSIKINTKRPFSNIENAQSRFLIIGYQIIFIVSKCPFTMSQTLNDILITVSINLTELGRWGWIPGNEDKFIAAGEKLLILIDDVGTKISTEINNMH